MSNEDLDSLLQKEQEGLLVEFWDDTAKLIVIYGVALGMSYLHSLKIMHRNLKPSNILLDDQLFPKLSSFALSKNIEESDSNTANVGTPLFMAPEVFIESKYSLAADVYSFAMVVYMIISKKKNCTGYSVPQFLNKVANEKFRPEIPDDVPQCYRELIESCWSQDPSDRPSFNEIVELLRNDERFITENFDEDKYRSYIRYIDDCVNKETEISKETFGTYSLKLIEASKKKGIINPQDFEMKETIEENEETEISSITNKNTKETFLAFISKKDYNFSPSSEEEKEICKEIKKNVKMKFSTVQRMIGYSFYDFKYQTKPLIIFQYNSRNTLNDIIKRHKRVEYNDEIDFTNKLKIILGISSGIFYFHEHNIYLPYLNPKNIYIDDTFHPTICYFDFNKLKIKNTIQGSIYTAPEIINGEKYSKSSDVYSFGKIVYFIMTQEEAVEGEMIEELVVKMKTKNIPTRYSELIITCLSNKKDERPSFDKIIYDLENDDQFITDEINKDEYQEYVNIIEDEFMKIYLTECEEEEEEEEEEEINEMMEKLKSLNIQYIDLKNYEKVHRIARGGCSKVIKIKDKTTGEFYAAKKLFSNDINDLIQELSVFSDIKHESIIKLIGYSLRSFKNKPRNIIIIEYVKNGSLEQLLEKERSGCEFKFWTETMKLINIHGLASVMSYLHSKSILHLDIKPNNNLLNEYLFPKLIDFGLSKKFMSSEIMKQTTTELKCTFQYAAPEILQSHEYTEAADVYAFAVEVFEIMNKECPFKGLNVQQIINKVVNNKGRPEFTNDIPAAYKQLIESCWCQEANDRLKFRQIVDILRNDKSFITEKVDEKLYRAYVDYIDGKIEDKSKLDEIFKKYSVQREYKKQERKRILPIREGFVSLSKFKVLYRVRQGIISDVYKVMNIDTKVEYLASISNFEIEDFSNQRILRIMNEVKELLTLKTPTIQHFIGFSFYDFQRSPNPVSINELLPNKTLYEILEEERHGKINMKATDKLIILYGICYGMFYLHSHKISHPTLNTTNVYIDERNHPILSEIGKYTLPQSSQTVSNLTSSEMTHIDFYCAPEIIEQKEDTLKSDVYSYSFIVYEVMTGDIPFDDKDVKNHSKLISEILVKNHRPKIKEQLTSNYKELIERCWEGNPELRPSFEDIIKELESDEFITSDIDEEEYRKYINSIKNNQK
ncbi:hypothetical protein M9Y10_001372 [Tritrichomonas musculus]|uniref:Protein kinase domain-containing protein n=1 Tax=Tritrichomonas musculus TaxID=1915356 RepID=A0ABR2L7Q9_9EUKA